MTTPTESLRARADAAVAAYQTGNWAEARERLDGIVLERPEAGAFALLAVACFKLDDAPAAHAAADRALTADARNLRAVIVKADLLASQGARREANLYYAAALDIGGRVANLPPDLAEGVARARAVRDSLTADMGQKIFAELEAAGYREGKSDRRFTHALDLLTGKRQLFLQQPQAFYYPELPHVQYYPRETMPWMDAVEAGTEAMIEELAAVLRDDVGFEPYLKTDPNLPSRPDETLIDSLNWSAHFLWKDGRETPNAAKCPRTMAALAGAPLCQVPGRSPQVMFSQLKAGAHIRPHTGFVNTRLTCHLPLIVPPGCQFRVGNEVREWVKGRCWAFDDTIEHEARNSSDKTRVVLIFDIWRPELNEEERHLVSTLLEAIDAFSPQTASWE